MKSTWGVSRRVSDRIRIGIDIQPSGVQQGFWQVGVRPAGEVSGRWMALGPVWVRLGSRSSWRDEDLDAEMIKPVEP